MPQASSTMPGDDDDHGSRSTPHPTAAPLTAATAVYDQQHTYKKGQGTVLSTLKDLAS
jgi:hypothetical protein